MNGLLAAGAFLLLAAAPFPLERQEAPEPVPCRDLEPARQLDFWIGTWDVLHPVTGDTLGVNVIAPALDHCVLLESWTGAGGSSGRSMNFYDRQRDTWRQVWVSDRGNVLDYRRGQLRGATMDFRGITIDEDGDTTLQKLLLVSPAPDSVRQVFETSTDRGSSWDTAWVGIYIRRPPEP